MQLVLKRGSIIDKSLTFDVGLIQLRHANMFQSKCYNINCAEGLHFSAFFIIVVIYTAGYCKQLGIL